MEFGEAAELKYIRVPSENRGNEEPHQLTPHRLVFPKSKTQHAALVVRRGRLAKPVAQVDKDPTQCLELRQSVE